MKKLITVLLLTIASSYAQKAEDKITFTAKIANRNSDSIVIRSGRNFSKTIKINKKGEFQESFAVTTGLFQLFDGSESTILFLKNGYDLKLTIDAKEFDETVVYTGKGSKENNFLAQKALTDELFEMELEGLLEKEESEFKAALEKKKTSDLANLEKAGLDAKLIEIAKPMINQESTMLLQYFNQKSSAKKLENSVAPAFDYENHKGGKTKLEDLRGKYVYIDVWATWCGPCIAEIPHLKKVEEKFHGKNIEFVSISVDTDKDREKWKKFVTDKHLGGVQLFADKNWNSDFIKAFGVNSIPRFLLIDPDGKVLNADAARPSSPRLTELLESLLK
jgi:thiol-disulfide isomerase/thioredoxin